MVYDQTDHHCVVSKFSDWDGAVGGHTVMDIDGEQQGAQETTLGGANVEGVWGIATYLNYLWLIGEVVNPFADQVVQP